MLFKVNQNKMHHFITGACKIMTWRDKFPYMRLTSLELYEITGTVYNLYA